MLIACANLCISTRRNSFNTDKAVIPGPVSYAFIVVHRLVVLEASRDLSSSLEAGINSDSVPDSTVKVSGKDSTAAKDDVESMTPEEMVLAAVRL